MFCILSARAYIFKYVIIVFFIEEARSESVHLHWHRAVCRAPPQVSLLVHRVGGMLVVDDAPALDQTFHAAPRTTRASAAAAVSTALNVDQCENYR